MPPLHAGRRTGLARCRLTALRFGIGLPSVCRRFGVGSGSVRHEDEHQVAFAGHLAVEQRFARTLTGSRRHPAQFHNEFQRVSRANLAAKASAIKTTEERQFASKTIVAENGDGAHLRDRLAHQHAGQRRATWKVSSKKPLVTGEMPESLGAKARFNLENFINEQKRRPMVTSAAASRDPLCGPETHQLDEVDFGWQVARDFEADFLLANFRLCPNFHSFLRWWLLNCRP